ncbi:glycosyltransferase involved in cell wall biosynthesis [Bacillus pakistanensis]|uniref:Glycosyltransferase involved in cell wall biosynthesis n=1 Tax=Rossellomorea pakistanensis TaxID=992288 RepID=A0ABS2N9D0_9BACI|nr:glycosyltransferase family 1 protein [Bacillus pakistanensis]MBM7584385.1 glycosyltransferase involved in cell wall biosynthesis [Bacillus pakistanensis]
MRIAIFSDTYFPQVNGVARTLKKLSDHLNKRGIEHELFVPEIENSPNYPNVHQFSSFPFIFYPECRTAIANPKTVEKRLRGFAPDLIHIATPLTMGLYGLHVSKKLGVPAVASYHTHFDRYLDYYKMSFISPVLWRYMKWFHAPVHKIFVPSLETKDHLIAHGFENVTVWSRGVDCQFFHPLKRTSSLKEKYHIKEKYVFLYAGRIAPEKDLQTLVNTINQLSPETKKQIHWLIVGSGPGLSELKQKLQNENVTFTGYLKGNDLAEAYASSDVFFFPSPTETFGNVVLEAFASGIPAIVSNKGGVTSIVENNRSGVICESQNTEQFVAAVERVIGDHSFYLHLKSNARKYAEKQSWEEIMDHLLSDYMEVIVSNAEFPKAL